MNNLANNFKTAAAKNSNFDEINLEALKLACSIFQVDSFYKDQQEVLKGRIRKKIKIIMR